MVSTRVFGTLGLCSNQGKAEKQRDLLVMKKKIFTTLIIILLASCLFASSPFNITLGVTSAFQKANLGKVSEINEIAVEDFKYGADLSVRLLFLEANAKSFVAKDTEGNTLINGIISANLSLNIIILRVKLGLGYQYMYDTLSKSYVFGRGLTSYEDFEKAEFDIYAGVDIPLDKFVIGVYGTLPTGVSIEKNNWDEIISTVENNWENAQIGVSIGINLL